MKLKKSSIAAGSVLGALLFVSVYEGKVQLSHGDRQIVLARGESGSVGADGIPERVLSQATGSGPVKASSEVARATLAATRRLSPEQQQLRDRVLAAKREHEARKAAAGTAPAASAGSTNSGDGTMADKTGHLGPEVKIMNHELMPMIDQCAGEAQQRKPHLHGMLALSVELSGAEGVGSIIETMEPADRNEVSDDELIDCIRQSAFSIQLPPPSADRGDRFEMTIPFGSDAGTH